MPNDTIPSDGTGQAEANQATTLDVAGFHKMLSKRTLERDQAKEEAEALRQQIIDLNAAIAAPDTEEASGPSAAASDDEDASESTGWSGDQPVTPKPRGSNGARDWADEHRDQNTQDSLLDSIAAFEGKSRGFGPWGS